MNNHDLINMIPFQLYIKARGLPDTILNKMQRRNASDPFTFKSIKALLAMLQAPIINSKDLHLEFILQMEGKTVLSYYLNQRMFQQLTYENSECGDLLLSARFGSHVYDFRSSGANAADHTDRQPHQHADGALAIHESLHGAYCAGNLLRRSAADHRADLASWEYYGAA